MTKDQPPVPDAPLANPYRTRLSVLFAANGSQAVILRRGPRKHVRLIMWNLEDDTFEFGQWMKGIVRLCDLSPDAGKLIYWAAQHHPRSREPRSRAGGYSPEFAPLPKAERKRLLRRRKVPAYLASAVRSVSRRQISDTWTAISTPPYFSALAFWPAIGYWTGGGYFVSGNVIGLFETVDGLAPVENVAIPPGLEVRSVGPQYGFMPAARRPAHNPAAMVALGGRFLTVEAGQSLWVALEAGLPSWLAERGPPSGTHPPHWPAQLDWVIDDGKDVLFASEGCLFRMKGGLVAPVDNLPTPDLLIDLAPMSFELVAPPASAMAW